MGTWPKLASESPPPEGWDSKWTEGNLGIAHDHLVNHREESPLDSGKRPKGREEFLMTLLEHLALAMPEAPSLQSFGAVNIPPSLSPSGGGFISLAVGNSPSLEPRQESTHSSCPGCKALCQAQRYIGR